MLSGTEFQLEIGPVPINVTGLPITATGVNGQIPAPILRWREGDTVTLAVTNRLSEPSSIHWHGVRTPAPMDGVPGLSFRGIPPGETFVYRFPVRQSGTYWYHSHSGIPGTDRRLRADRHRAEGRLRAGVRPRLRGDAVGLDRREPRHDRQQPQIPERLLQLQAAHARHVRSMTSDAKGSRATVADRLEWGSMRMSPTDILDVSGATYTYLINGQPPRANWTALFQPGERVRLRFINGSSMSIFDVRIRRPADDRGPGRRQRCRAGDRRRIPHQRRRNL